MSGKPRLVVMDVAGTTVAASDDVAAAIRAAFSAFRIDVSPEAIAAVRGKSKRQAIRELLDATGGGPTPVVAAGDVYRDFRRRLVESSGGWRPIPGARDTIDWLRARGVGVALITGIDRSVLEALLDRLGWSGGLLSSALCADDVRRGRPAPDLILRSMERCDVSDPRAVAVVGDTTNDLLAAEAAGVGWSIGVLTGAHTRAELARCSPSAILDSVADLPDWWKTEDPAVEDSSSIHTRRDHLR